MSIPVLPKGGLSEPEQSQQRDVPINERCELMKHQQLEVGANLITSFANIKVKERMATTGGVRARIVVGNWKSELAEKYDFCWMRRTGAERREHS